MSSCFGSRLHFPGFHDNRAIGAALVMTLRWAYGGRLDSAAQDDDVQVGTLSLPCSVELLDMHVIGSEVARFGPVGTVAEERRESSQPVGAQVEAHLA